MGIEFDFVCDTCRKTIDMGKASNKEMVLPLLEQVHRGHDYGVVSDFDYEFMSESYHLYRGNLHAQGMDEDAYEYMWVYDDHPEWR